MVEGNAEDLLFWNYEATLEILLLERLSSFPIKTVPKITPTITKRPLMNGAIMPKLGT